jgi:hypothetical protein
MLGSADYTASNGTTVVLATGATAGDLITTESFYVSSVLNAIPAVAGAVTDTYLNTGAVTQSKVATGVAGTGPAFSVYSSSTLSISASTPTKINFDTKVFDTASCFNTSLYRFTPNVAGYYQINGSAYYSGSGIAYGQMRLYKNGSNYNQGAFIYIPSPTTSDTATNISTLVYMNGTTDYLELYGFQYSGTGTVVANSSTYTFFNGALVRAA